MKGWVKRGDFVKSVKHKVITWLREHVKQFGYSFTRIRNQIRLVIGSGLHRVIRGERVRLCLTALEKIEISQFFSSLGKRFGLTARSITEGARAVTCTFLLPSTL